MFLISFYKILTRKINEEVFSSLKKANNRLSFINTKYNIDGQKSLKNNININNFIPIYTI